MTLKQALFSLLIFTSVLWGTVWHFLPIGERDVSLDVSTLWQESSVYGDAEYYLRQADDFALSIAPYRYRVLPTLAVRAINAALGVPPVVGYVLLNSLCFLLTGIGFTAYLMRWHGFTYAVALVGGLLAVTTVSLQSTMLLPMAEASSYVAALAVFWAYHTRRPLVFGVTASLAILTKEVFIVVVPIYVVVELLRDVSAASVLRDGATHVS